MQVISRPVHTGDRITQVCDTVSYLESKPIREVSSWVLWRLIGQPSAVTTLSFLLTGSRGEYLRVVGIHRDG